MITETSGDPGGASGETSSSEREFKLRTMAMTGGTIHGNVHSSAAVTAIDHAGSAAGSALGARSPRATITAAAS